MKQIIVDRLPPSEYPDLVRGFLDSAVEHALRGDHEGAASKIKEMESLYENPTNKRFIRRFAQHYLKNEKEHAFRAKAREKFRRMVEEEEHDGSCGCAIS